MPYSRRFVRPYRRRRRWKRNQPGNKKVSWYNRKYSVSQLAAQAFRGMKYVKGLVNSEMFVLDTAMLQSPTDSGTITHVTAIGQGDGSGSRTGNSVLAKWLSIRAFAYVHGSATDTAIRLMVVMDKQQQGDTAPGVADVLDTASATYNYLAFLNPDQKGRFSILHDEIWTMNNVSKKDLIKKVNIKLDKHIRYNGANTTDIQKNGIYVISISSEATNAPALKIEARLGYHDN